MYQTGGGNVSKGPLSSSSPQRRAMREARACK